MIEKMRRRRSSNYTPDTVNTYAFTILRVRYYHNAHFTDEETKAVCEQ